MLLNVQNVSATELSGEFMHGVRDRLLQAAGKALKEATAKCGAANIPFEDLVRTGGRSRRRLRKSLVIQGSTTL